MNIHEVLETTAEVWDKYESADEVSDVEITAGMRRAAEAEKAVVSRHIAEAQRVAAKRREVMERRVEMQRRQAARWQIALELEVAVPERNHKAHLSSVLTQLRAEAQQRDATSLATIERC